MKQESVYIIKTNYRFFQDLKMFGKTSESTGGFLFLWSLFTLNLGLAFGWFWLLTRDVKLSFIAFVLNSYCLLSNRVVYLNALSTSKLILYFSFSDIFDLSRLIGLRSGKMSPRCSRDSASRHFLSFFNFLMIIKKISFISINQQLYHSLNRTKSKIKSKLN